MILSTLLMALRELRRNTLRSLLTMLGIVIGVGAVIALTNIGEGATARVKADIGKLGDNLLIVRPGAQRRSISFTQAPAFKLADVEAIRREVSGVSQVAPTAGSSQLAVWGNQNRQTTIMGADNAYLEVRGYSVAQGRTFAASELSSGSAACLIGATVQREMFGERDALGQSVRVGKISCTVVGVLASKGESGIGQDQDDMILMPLRTVQRRLLGNSDVSTIFLSARADRSTQSVEQQTEALLRQRRGLQAGQESDFMVRDMQEVAETMSQATGTLTALLGAIAAVSLLVGGIGIMNIMLVNVTERTREIGVRLAIGALASDVLFQFLLEAVVLSAFGGVLGIGLGLGLSWSVTRALGLPFLVKPPILMLAFGFSAMVGVLFGFLPARKAASLNPIEALRHE
ncbi:MAG TPA: ABC transporter permease [Polyangiaceae bacterium]|jgi:putative ABC transport system permease protein|nr:ABC transporter permease [Polyangiaceae bacterium]